MTELTPAKVAESVKETVAKAGGREREIEEKSAPRLARFREYAPTFMSAGGNLLGKCSGVRNCPGS